MTATAPAPVPHTDPSAAADDGAGIASARSLPWRIGLERSVRLLWGGVLAGLLAGSVFGAVGGRIAMRIVTLQSDPRLDGVTTDDGAQVNEMTVDGTVLLALFTTFIGVLGALVYLVVRPTLPTATRARAALFAIVTGTIGGSMVVHTDGVDFTLLGSPRVSAVLFVALLVGYGATVATVTERLVRPGGRAWTVRRRWLPVPMVALAPGFAIVPVSVAVASVATAHHLGLARLLARPAVTWLIRALLVVATAWAAVDLARTAIAL